MTAQEILHQFERGQTTTGLVLNVLSQPSKRVVAETLETLPASVLKEFRKFVGYYQPSKLVIRGPRPNMRTVRFVRQWFDKTGNSRIRRHFIGTDLERFLLEGRAL